MIIKKHLVFVADLFLFVIYLLLAAGHRLVDFSHKTRKNGVKVINKS